MDNKEIYEIYNEVRKSENRSIKDIAIKVIFNHFPQLIIPELKYFKKLDKKTKILELGCGEGRFLNALSKLGFTQIQGVELATNYTSFFENIIHQDLISYLDSLPNESEEYIVMLDVLEHFEKNQALHIIDLVYKKLKSNGQILIRVPNIMSWSGQFNQYSDPTHQTIFTEDFIVQILRNNQFKDIHVFGSEKWIKIFIDPRRWIGGLFYLLIWVFNYFRRVAFGGPKIHTINLTGLAKK